MTSTADIDNAARAVNRLGGARLMDLRERSASDARLFARARSIVSALPAPDRAVLDEAFAQANSGMGLGDAARLNALTAAACVRAGGMAPEEN
jgi:hypothetical protein